MAKVLSMMASALKTKIPPNPGGGLDGIAYKVPLRKRGI
jgi:hypothetical protein